MYALPIDMTPEYARVMARCNRWMNEKLYAIVEKLTDEERKKDRGAFFGSIHRTLNHLLLADRVWLARFTGVELKEGELGPGGIRTLDQELYADFDELRRERAKTDDEIDAYVATLTEEKLAGTLRYLRHGVVNEFPLWHAVTHFFNHQTHHRGPGDDAAHAGRTRSGRDGSPDDVPELTTARVRWIITRYSRRLR
jgi:uncharacterized damage-inducible protein DinB